MQNIKDKNIFLYANVGCVIYSSILVIKNNIFWFYD